MATCRSVLPIHPQPQLSHTISTDNADLVSPMTGMSIIDIDIAYKVSVTNIQVTPKRLDIVKTVIFAAIIQIFVKCYQIRFNIISLIVEILFMQDIDIDKKEDNSHYFSTIEPDL